MNNNKVVFLQDTDLLVSDVKSYCMNVVKTLGVNKINHEKGVELILEGTVLPYFHPQEMREACKDIIDRTIEDCLSNFPEEMNVDKVDEFYHTLSMRDNFRKLIDPSYKNKGIKKLNSFANPEIRQFFIDEYEVYDKINNPNGKVFVGSDLEGDDRIGISATYFYRKYLSQGYNPIIIVCSEDKDMRTIPNIYIYNPSNQDFFYNDYLSATKFWLAQILAGDIADNIIKTPKKIKDNKIQKNGYAMKTALEFVDERIKKGIKKTYCDIKYLYEMNGMSSQCEINAQLLRILTIDFFDHVNQKPILFKEEMLDEMDDKFFNEMNWQK